MGAFSGLKDAKRGFNSNPMREGEYVVRIDACEFFECKTRSGGDAEMWKNTLTILAVNRGDDPHRVGEIVHTFFKCGDGTPKETFQANLKGFIAGVMDQSDEAVDENAASEVLGKNNPLCGLVTVVKASTRASKKKRDEKNNPFTYMVYSWSPTLSKDAIVEAIGEEGVRTHFPNGL